MIPIAQNDSVLGVVSMWLRVVVDKERSSKAVNILSGEMAMHPVCSPLFSNRNLVGKGVSWWNRTSKSDPNFQMASSTGAKLDYRLTIVSPLHFRQNGCDYGGTSHDDEAL